MGADVSAAAIKWQMPPATTKGRPAAITVLQIQQPGNPGQRGLARFRCQAQIAQRQQSPGGVIRIWYCARQRRPGPTTRSRRRERMYFVVLLIEQPSAHWMSAFAEVFPTTIRERID